MLLELLLTIDFQDYSNLVAQEQTLVEFIIISLATSDGFLFSLFTQISSTLVLCTKICFDKRD